MPNANPNLRTVSSPIPIGYAPPALHGTRQRMRREQDRAMGTAIAAIVRRMFRRRLRSAVPMVGGRRYVLRRSIHRSISHREPMYSSHDIPTNTDRYRRRGQAMESRGLVTSHSQEIASSTMQWHWHWQPMLKRRQRIGLKSVGSATARAHSEH